MEFRAVISAGQFHHLVNLDMSDLWQTVCIYAGSTYNLEDFVELVLRMREQLLVLQY